MNFPDDNDNIPERADYATTDRHVATHDPDPLEATQQPTPVVASIAIDSPTPAIVPPTAVDTTTAAMPVLAGPPDLIISLPPRDLQLLWAARTITGPDGRVWFDLRSDGVYMSATGAELALTARLDARVESSPPTQSPGLGVRARDLASRVAGRLQDNRGQEHKSGLDLHFYQQQRIVEVRESLSGIMGGFRPEDSLFVKFEQISLEETISDLRRVQEAQGLHFFDIELDPSLALEPPGPPPTDSSPSTAVAVPPPRSLSVHRATLQQLLAAAVPLVAPAVADPSHAIIELRAGVFFGGDLHLTFWSETAFSSQLAFRLTRQQADRLRSLLLLCPGRHLDFTPTDTHYVLQSGTFSFRVNIPPYYHPASIAQDIAAQPNAGVVVDTSDLRRALMFVRKGAAEHCPSAVLRVLLIPRPSPRLQLFVYNPAPRARSHASTDDGRLAASPPVPGTFHGSVANFDWVLSLELFAKATDNFSGPLSLCGDGSFLYITGAVGDRNGLSLNAPSRLVRTVRVAAKPISSLRQALRTIQSFAPPLPRPAGRKRLGN